jgi:hypothetical protein
MKPYKIADVHATWFGTTLIRLGIPSRLFPWRWCWRRNLAMALIFYLVSIWHSLGWKT